MSLDPAHLSNIPEELKKLQQWVCFDIHNDKKIPYTPGSDNMAASNRPRDWRSFRAALADVESGRRQHLGFCFTSSDPYVFIDLDDPSDPEQVAVFERIDTYAQRSISGAGCHLICKGTFDGPGRHPSHPNAGLFKENRFCLMTGDLSPGRTTIKAVGQEQLQSLHLWLSTGADSAPTIDLVEYQPEIPDQTILEMGRDRFPHKFEDLCRGDWRKHEEYHSDHSTADHAFIAMLCDLTESNEQVRWFFHTSGMWTDERAEKKAGHGLTGYVDRTIRKIRSEQAANRKNRKRIDFHQPEGNADEGGGRGFRTDESMIGFPTTRIDEINDAKETQDLVQGLLVERTMSVFYGPSNCGKSFLCLYLAACVAMGIPFLGKEVTQGAVIYFGLEGEVGIRNRIVAMKAEGILSDNAALHLCFSPLSLLDENHADFVANTVARIQKEEGCKVMLIVIDTYARAMAGGDENSGKDTSAVIATLDAIRTASKAHVMLIHHCGKDEARGARGHSSLRAATDTEIEITRPDAASPSVVSVKKQRDLPVAEVICFRLNSVHLGTDSRGVPITSCVVQHEEGHDLSPRKKGRPKKTPEAAILALLPQESTTSWKKAAAEKLNVSPTAFFRAIKVIKISGKAVGTTSGGWEPKLDFRKLVSGA